MSLDEELLAVFKAEVRERVEQLSLGLCEPAPRWDVPALCRLAHNIKGAARMAEAAPIIACVHELEEVLIAVREGAKRTRSVAELARRGCQLLDATIEGHTQGKSVPDLSAFSERVHAWLASARAGQALEPLDGPAGPMVSAPPAAPVVAPTSAPPITAAVATDTKAEPEAKSGVAQGEGFATEPARQADDTLRVAVAKLDRLMGLAAELVMAVFNGRDRQQAAATLATGLVELGRSHPTLAVEPAFRRLRREAAALRRGLLDDVGRSERLSEMMQDAIRALRMVPVGSLRSLFGRTLREACEHTGRQASLAILGEETEIDRAVLEGLIDPLVHLLRNAVAHGIEAPEERVTLGKDAAGTITLQASSVGAWVELSVSDDGGGLSLDKIRAAAMRAGIVTPSAAAKLSTRELTDLIFLAGLSTVSKADELSGRGIGLDVVKRNVTRLGGEISVSSAMRRGTSFRLRVPLTRLTTRGIVVRLGEHQLAVPVANVERTVWVNHDQIGSADGQDLVVLDGRPTPVAGLEAVLGVGADALARRPSLVVGDGKGRHAFLVDEVLGQREFIVQPLGSRLRAVPGVAGLTVLEGGKTAFVLDTLQLIAWRGAARGATGGRHAEPVERQRRVLIADDSVTSRTLLKNLLGAAGYEVVLANDGSEAWQVLMTQNFDVLVSDVEMPGIDGFELTRRVRAHATLQRLPVVLVTSLGQPEHRRLGAEAGANAHVVKGSFDQEELLTAVARLI